MAVVTQDVKEEELGFYRAWPSPWVAHRTQDQTHAGHCVLCGGLSWLSGVLFPLALTFMYPHNSAVILVHYHRRR